MIFDRKTKILIISVVCLVGIGVIGYLNATTGSGNESLFPGIPGATSTNPQLSSAGSSEPDIENKAVQGQPSGSNPNSDSSKTGTNPKISVSEAKQIAQTYVSNDQTVGTPVLKTIDDKQTYVVPILSNGQQVGEIYIDANTGSYLGGAGGST